MTAESTYRILTCVTALLVVMVTRHFAKVMGYNWGEHEVYILLVCGLISGVGMAWWVDAIGKRCGSEFVTSRDMTSITPTRMESFSGILLAVILISAFTFFAPASVWILMTQENQKILASVAILFSIGFAWASVLAWRSCRAKLYLTDRGVTSECGTRLRKVPYDEIVGYCFAVGCLRLDLKGGQRINLSMPLLWSRRYERARELIGGVLNGEIVSGKLGT